MPETRVCPKCNAPLPANAPGGICPKCLLSAGLPSEPVTAGFTPPEPAELAADFPELEIQQLLGKGGMGAVYKARQKRLDRWVAVKIMPPEVGEDPAFAARFEREARTLAKLNHPNIIQVYDFGQSERFFYFVMEYVDGSNLRKIIEAGGLEPRDALAIVPNICAALQYAHDAGVVHRDIKPENILIDQQGQVKIADFGLAMLLDRPPADVTLTGTNQVMGTPHYMAPEQTRGSHSIDHRADIYSLGVVFYELLTGELPIGHFEAPSKKMQVDVRLDEVVLRALDADPDRRYQHASEVQHDVEQLSSAESRSNNADTPRMPADHRVRSPIADETHTSSPVRLLLLIVGNLWLLAAVALLLGKKVARTQPTMYSFFDIGAWLYPSTYNTLVVFCGLLSLACLLFAWRGRRSHSVWSPSKRQPSGAANTTAEFSSLGTRTHPTSITPRFCRKALVGGCWAPFFFVASILMFYVETETTRAPAPIVRGLRAGSQIAEPRADEAVTDPPGAAAPGLHTVQTRVEPIRRADAQRGRTAGQWLLALTVLPLGLTAPFGTTILGLAAISSIRHSHGRLTGLPLAVADTLFFPLLILDAVVGWVVVFALPDVFGRGLNLATSLVLCLVLVAIIDYYIARAVWRNASASV